MKLMTNALLLLLALCGAPAFAQSCPEGCCPEGCCEEEKAVEKKDAKKEEVKANTFEVSLEGMCCANCTKAVIKRLSKVEGVESVKCCHESGKAWVTMKEGKTLDKAAVEKALEDTEFKTTAVVKFEPKKEEKKEEKKEG